jgi:MerR family mercuric resistance operon transcriptional regulator
VASGSESPVRSRGRSALTIGAVARGAGVHIETLRYYERRGLLSRPARSVANYRVYDAEAVRRVRLIKRAQQLGFTLAEIEELLSLRAAPKARCADVRDRASAKIRDIEARIAALEAMKTALRKLVRECAGSGPVSRCPILDSLDAENGGRTATERRSRR